MLAAVRAGVKTRRLRLAITAVPITIRAPSVT